MNIHKSKIDWCTHTWNPVTGCRHDCPYCYAQRFIDRFGPKPDEWQDDAVETVRDAADHMDAYISGRPARLNNPDGSYKRSTGYPRGFAPTFHTYTLDYPEKRLTPAAIFVTSMGDLFGEWVPDEWIERVFAACEKAPQHTYMFLTKNPIRYGQLHYAGKLPQRPNMWYGSTASTEERPVFRLEGYKTFISIEPILGPFSALEEGRDIADWIIVGAMTGPTAKRDAPKREWITALKETCEKRHIPLFMKGSLEKLMGSDFIQQYPTEMKQSKGGATA